MSYYVHHRVLKARKCGVVKSGPSRETHNLEVVGSNPSPATKVEACLVRGKVSGALFHDYVPLGHVFTNVKGALSGVRGSVFLLRNATLLDVAVHAHVGFSMGLKRLSSWRFSGKGLFSGFIVSLASVELFGQANLCSNTVCRNIKLLLHGMDGYGNK